MKWRILIIALTLTGCSFRRPVLKFSDRGNDNQRYIVEINHKKVWDVRMLMWGDDVNAEFIETVTNKLKKEMTTIYYGK